MTRNGIIDDLMGYGNWFPLHRPLLHVMSFQEVGLLGEILNIRQMEREKAGKPIEWVPVSERRVFIAIGMNVDVQRRVFRKLKKWNLIETKQVGQSRRRLVKVDRETLLDLYETGLQISKERRAEWDETTLDDGEG
jgi:hypothetical protein